MTSPTIIWWRSGRWSFEWPQRPSSAPPCPSKTEQKGIGGVSQGERLRATPTGPNRTTGLVQATRSCGSQPVASHSTPRSASARCSTPPAGRALSFVGRPASRRDPISRERARRQTLALRPRERRRATHRRRAPSMVSGVDGGRPSATENRLDLPLERCPVFWARRSRSPGMLTLTCYPPIPGFWG